MKFFSIVLFIKGEFQSLLETVSIKQGGRPKGWDINPANK